MQAQLLPVQGAIKCQQPPLTDASRPGSTRSTRPTRTSASRSGTWASPPSAALQAVHRHRGHHRRPPRLEGTRRGVASIDTGESNRDGHLQSPEFFDAQQYPQITFETTATELTGNGQITLVGEITIKGTTKPIELTGTLAENGEDPWGKERIGFELEGKIDRREFDLKWNQTLPNGNLLVSNDVKLVISVSAVKEG